MKAEIKSWEQKDLSSCLWVIILFSLCSFSTAIVAVKDTQKLCFDVDFVTEYKGSIITRPGLLQVPVFDVIDMDVDEEGSNIAAVP